MRSQHSVGERTIRQLHGDEAVEGNDGRHGVRHLGVTDRIYGGAVKAHGGVHVCGEYHPLVRALVESDEHAPVRTVPHYLLCRRSKVGYGYFVVIHRVVNEACARLINEHHASAGWVGEHFFDTTFMLVLVHHRHVSQANEGNHALFGTVNKEFRCCRDARHVHLSLLFRKHSGLHGGVGVERVHLHPTLAEHGGIVAVELDSGDTTCVLLLEEEAGRATTFNVIIRGNVVHTQREVRRAE
mmetsp:Transcript_47570/g.123194  ORF Transcript_47570/g.123194 Transcript_47570/m.123194 type:complete len:241 (-) Transcript_47570:1150-1872(-)